MVHSLDWPNSPPMNTSFFPGCPYIHARNIRRLANFCHSSPGILDKNERLPYTISSWLRTEDEIFLERVEQRERDIAVVKAPVNRIDAHVMQEIVHPAHVPFEAEAQARRDKSDA